MDEQHTGPAPARTVFLAREGGAVGAVPGGCVRVSSPYEAAAELLCAPTAVLVVELSLLSRRHLPLLALAREMEVDLLGVGALPGDLTADELAGVRLTSADELVHEVARSARRWAETPPESTEPRSPHRQPEGAWEPHPAARREAAASASPEPPPDQAEDEAEAGFWRSEREPPAPEPEPRDEKGEEESPHHARHLLSPEELAALLEDPT